MSDLTNYPVSARARHFKLMQGDRVVFSTLLDGEWGPFWLLHDVEIGIINARGKRTLPFNAGTGKGYVLKALGLREHINSPEEVADIESRIKKTPVNGSDRRLHRRLHRSIMEDENQPTKERGVNTVSRKPRSKRKIRVSGF